MAFEQHGMKLVGLIDQSMELFETDDSFGSFHLGGQTIVMDDYLEIKSRNKESLKKHVREGRFISWEAVLEVDMKALKNIGFLFAVLWKNNKKYFGAVAAVCILPAVINLVQVTFPKGILEALERQDITGTGILAVSMCVLVFCMEALSSFAEYKKYGCTGDFGIVLNRLLAEAAAKWPYEKFEEFASRERYHFAVMCIREGTADAVIGCVVSAAGSLLSLFSLLYISQKVVWWLWIVMALSIVINIGCEIYRANYDYKSYEEYNSVDMCMLYARDVLTRKEFAKESRLFSMYDYVSSTANHYINLLSSLQSKRAVKTFKTYFLSCIFDFMQRIAVFGYIAYEAYSGRISTADFSMLTLALITISALCIQIAKNIIRVGETAKYIEAYVHIIRDGETMDGKGSLEEKSEDRLDLRFEHVTFSYPGADFTALEDISYAFEAGKKYGIVGANGSGKTTFINLLTGMYSPTAGIISCNGRKMSEVSGESWRKMFSAVCQDFNIYAYTAEENVTMYQNDKAGNVRDALERAGIGWLDETEYLTSEYEQGRELSGGEAQKLAFARAIYRDAAIFVFDEPTAALSPTSEQELYESVFREMEDKTVFFISHRLASCRMCDEILVFEKGRIAESGGHEELMKKGGLYAEMYRAQASLYGKQQAALS